MIINRINSIPKTNTVLRSTSPKREVASSAVVADKQEPSNNKKNQNKTILSILAVIALVVVGYFIFRGKKMRKEFGELYF